MSLPFDQPTFEQIVSKFHIHQALQIILFRGASVIHRISYTVPQPNGPPLPCFSKVSPPLSHFLPSNLRRPSAYILRTSISTFPDLALSLSYYPTAPHRVYAVFFGLSPNQMSFIHDHLEFAGPAALHPFTLLNAFLDLEKRRRFADVDTYSRRMADLAENWGALTGDSEGVVRTYREVTVLREELEVWRGEVARLEEESKGDFMREMEGGGGRGMGLLEAGGYLRRLGGGYAEKGRVCEGVLQTAGFAFQVVSLSHASRGGRVVADRRVQEVTAMGREDTRTMKAIAVLTMLFLPATFVCVSFPLLLVFALPG